MLRLFSGRVRRLSQRRLPENVRAKTTTFAGPSIRFALRRFMKRRDSTEGFRDAVNCSNSLGEAMKREGFGRATHIYSMLGECAPLLASAKQRGLTVVSEIYILLSTERILAEERRKFPGWEPGTPDFAAIRRELGNEDVLLTYSDFFICPSEAVRDDLVENFHVPRARASVVPYGINPALLSLRNEPVRGRILFAGTAELRKGIHYLAMAAEKLAQQGLRYEFRVAGNVQPHVAKQTICHHLNFLGRVPRAEIGREFGSADVFVLPSLAEGSAEVIYEALACGLPIVATVETGSVVRDGIEGMIVASRDPEALADAIAQVIEDRPKRERMARAARERAREFTWERYGERLVDVLLSFASPNTLACEQRLS